ncbi:RDD family protein [Herbihabitans rhizosphaerae]|uniref:RDD family protein n=1 Tax=Herbihabitans rhizosphaerae TaxID=1872711 RepID=A0A4Q7KQZ7_9PSEU|nr:RDD family protein [Herbihabitans rhizosphaerae]RZS37762.1 RDD family protein [Herbihabitans rhizosphaerae]
MSEKSFWLNIVRYSDLRRLRSEPALQNANIPVAHGDDNDPRYPSKTTLRRVLGFIVDLALHWGIGIGAFLAMKKVPALEKFADKAWLGLFLGFLLASIVHRIFVQRLVYTTLGKAIFGVRYIRSDTGGPPTLWSLVKEWLFGILRFLAHY